MFWLLAAITAAGLLLITLSGLGLVSTATLVAVPTALFPAAGKRPPRVRGALPRRPRERQLMPSR